MSLLSATSRRSHATIVVATYMEGFLLSRDAYTRIVHEYPDFRRYIQTVARLRLKREAALHASGGGVATDTGQLELPVPGRASIILLEKLDATTSNGSAPQAAMLPMTKQDRAAERLVRKLEREHAERGRRRKNTNEEIVLAVAAEQRSFKVRKSSKERSASLQTWQQNISSFADGCTGAQHNLSSAENAASGDNPSSAENAASGASGGECTASAKPSSSSKA